jgi:hypothetical protein
MFQLQYPFKIPPLVKPNTTNKYFKHQTGWLLNLEHIFTTVIMVYYQEVLMSGSVFNYKARTQT